MAVPKVLRPSKHLLIGAKTKMKYLNFASNAKTLKRKNTAKVGGFTLIELLVATVITGIMLTLVLASYWTFLQTQQKMAMSRELQSEIRFALNRFADKVRSSNIDYEAYLGIPAGQNCGSENAGGSKKLCLIDPSGTFYYFEHADLDADTIPESFIMGSDATSFSDAKSNAQPLLSPKKFNVESLNFSFSPAADPTTLANPQMQPKVTVYIKVRPQNGMYQALVIESQTTISSRQY